MGGRIIRIVGLVLLAAIVATVASPWFDLHPTALRASRQAITHLSLAPIFLPGALPVSATFLTKPRTPQSHRANDIVARDCARLC